MTGDDADLTGALEAALGEEPTVADKLAVANPGYDAPDGAV